MAKAKSGQKTIFINGDHIYILLFLHKLDLLPLIWNKNSFEIC